MTAQDCACKRNTAELFRDQLAPWLLSLRKTSLAAEIAPPLKPVTFQPSKAVQRGAAAGCRAQAHLGFSCAREQIAFIKPANEEIKLQVDWLLEQHGSFPVISSCPVRRELPLYSRYVDT